jgi:NAD dependent epimerase/dehydratase
MPAKNTIGKKILVTGAGGFIGSHVVELLAQSGADVTAFVRYTSTGKAGFLDRFDPKLRSRLNIVYGDIRDRADVYRALDGNDYIIHLAAQIAIPYSYVSPGDFVTVNTIGTLNVLTAAREKKIKRLVQLSTSEVYGSAQYLPIDEKHPLVAQSPYAASKIAADKLAESFYRSYDLPIVIARPFNTYGPRQSSRAVIPTIILQALKGNIIRLGNIDTRRDLNFVEDTARTLALMALSKNGVGGQFNIATGNDYSIAEIVETVAEILGKNIKIKIDKRRVRPKLSEVSVLQGDPSLAEKNFHIGKRIGLKEGLEKTIRYFEAHIDQLRREDYQL